MPGFLGTEKQFTARYSKPILLSRDAKSSSKEQEAGQSSGSFIVLRVGGGVAVLNCMRHVWSFFFNII